MSKSEASASSSLSTEWELSKENVLPVKRGRSVAMLSDILGANPIKNTAKNEEERTKYFKSQLDLATGNPIEILNVYENQFKWTRDHFPSDSSRLITLLEKCTCELKEENSIRNDNKFIKMWIEYADLVKTPGDIFAFMNSNKIGEKNALFWLAWAYVTEKGGNFKLTDQIYQKGIRKLAIPKEILSKRYQEFQRRLARHYINMAEDTVIDTTNDNTSVGRVPLSKLSKTQAHSGSSRVVCDENNSLSRLPTQSSNTTTSSNSSSTMMNKKTSVSNKNKGFEIYTESDAVVDNLAENMNWKTLGTVQTTSKENSGLISKWTEAPLKVPSRLNSTQALSSITAATSVSSNAFDIFVDEELRNEEAPKISTQIQSKNKPVLTARMAFEKETIMDPLAKHKQASVVDSSHAPLISTLIDDDQKKYVPPAVSIDGKASTKFTVFADPTPEKSTQSLSTIKVPSKKIPKFTVFSDPSPEPILKQKCNVKPSTSSFTIFADNDDEIAVPEQNLPSKKVQSKSALNTSMNQTADAIELNNLLDDIGIYDNNDDSTINTRVARKNIDKMFCSPIAEDDDCGKSLKKGCLEKRGLFGTERVSLSITGFSDICKESSEKDRSIFGSIGSPTFGDNFLSDGLDDIDGLISNKVGKTIYLKESFIGNQLEISLAKLSLNYFALPLPSSVVPTTIARVSSRRLHGKDSLQCLLQASEEYRIDVKALTQAPFVTGSESSKTSLDPTLIKIKAVVRSDIPVTSDPTKVKEELETSEGSLDPTLVKESAAAESESPLSSLEPTKVKDESESPLSSLDPTLDQDEAAVEPKSPETSQGVTRATDEKMMIATPYYEIPLHKTEIELSLYVNKQRSTETFKTTEAIVLPSSITEQYIRYACQNPPKWSAIEINVLDTTIPRGLKSRKTVNCKTSILNIQLEDILVQKQIGFGSFGVVYTGSINNSHRKSGPKSDEQIVLKVDPEKSFIFWEVEIQSMICESLSYLNKSSFWNIYYKHFLPPARLIAYEDAAVAVMPFASLSSILNILRIKSCFNSNDYESFLAYIAAQMLDCVDLLHTCHIIHTDIKPDNWVIRPSIEGIKVCLIDFGKARPVRVKSTKKGQDVCSVSYIGGYAAKGVYSLDSSNPWSYCVDNIGIAACIHVLMFGQDLLTMSIKSSDVGDISGGYDKCEILKIIKDINARALTIPKCSLKRYHNRRVWTIFYTMLLNTFKTERADHKLLNEILLELSHPVSLQAILEKCHRSIADLFKATF